MFVREVHFPSQLINLLRLIQVGVGTFELVGARDRLHVIRLLLIDTLSLMHILNTAIFSNVISNINKSIIAYLI